LEIGHLARTVNCLNAADNFNRCTDFVSITIDLMVASSFSNKTTKWDAIAWYRMGKRILRSRLERDLFSSIKRLINDISRL
jgi:hypothetical protein